MNRLPRPQSATPLGQAEATEIPMWPQRIRAANISIDWTTT